MKKIISIIAAVLMLISVLGIVASAEEPVTLTSTAAPGKVKVTIYDGKSLVLTNWSVDLAGEDTIGSVLTAVHKDLGKKYETAKGEYGDYITCLWGVENGGSYGYYLNDKMAMGLTDPVKNGDVLVAFAYADAVGYSDSYSYFSEKSVTRKAGGDVTLTLSRIVFDESWNPVAVAVPGAELTFDGKATGVKTDESGKATLKVDKEGVISATLDGTKIIPPYCTVGLIGEETPAPQAQSSFPWVAVVIVAAVAVCACVVIIVVKKKK